MHDNNTQLITEDAVAAIIGPRGAARTEAIAQLLDPNADLEACNSVLDRLGALAGQSPAALDTVVTAIYERSFARAEICRYLLAPDDIDDALQDVVLAVTRQIGTYRSEGHLAAWVAGIARHKAVDILRRRTDTPTDSIADDTEVERFSSQIATRTDIDVAIEALPSHHREILRLRDIEHRTYQAIADHLGIELGTVRSRLARARAQLARSFQTESNDGDTTQ